MIIHFMFDEKIINSLIANFETANPSNNLYIIVKDSADKKLAHVTLRENTIVFNRKKDDINSIIKDIPVDAVICHILNIEFADILLKIHQPVDIYWSIWGYDVYALPEIRPTRYAPLTFAYLKKANIFQTALWFIYKNRTIREICFALKGKQDPYKKLEKVQTQVKACLTYIKEDVELLKSYYPHLQMKYIYFPFLNLKQYLGSNYANTSINGKNILIGNSNSDTSNHLDVLSFLAKEGFKAASVYVPLSYGGDNAYRNAVTESGTKLLGDLFKPMIDFISLKEYMEILQSCTVGIFYHYRQQGMGNIIAMLWMGARIYMSEKNPGYHYFLRLGIKVFDLDRDFILYKNSPLSMEDATENRKILTATFSAEVVAQQYKVVLDTILNPTAN
ncbi:4-alpha-L-fucosyltransferase [compost metagenome]